MIRVVLADDQELVRSAFAMLVRSAPDMDVVGEAGDGDEVVRVARSSRADVVVMDIRMPGSTGSRRPPPSPPTRTSPACGC